MAEDDKDILRTQRVKDKFGFVPGLTPDTDIPVCRYQVLHTKVFILQTWASGSTARGEMTIDELSKQFGKKIFKEGWYDAHGNFLGNDPGLD